jgi:Bacterial conjugation TrbI-like protein
MVGGLLLLTAAIVGGGYYLHLQQKARLAEQLRQPRPEPDTAGTKKFERAAYKPQPATTNGVETPRPPPPPPPAQKPASPKPAPPKPKVKVHNRASLVYFERKDPVKEESSGHEGELFAGTFIPCTLETRVNSDREGVAVARVRETIFDSRSGRLPVIPQGSTLVMPYLSKNLVFGDERIDVGLKTLTLPSGESIELPQEPGVDQIGQAGWTGEVDRHYWRLLRAVLISGVLKGTDRVIQQEATVYGPGGQVVGGVSSDASQAGQFQVRPYLNSRPTIIVPEGDRCTVILTKALTLPRR